MNKKVEKLFELFNENGLMLTNYKGRIGVIEPDEILFKGESKAGCRKKAIPMSRGSPGYSETEKQNIDVIDTFKDYAGKNIIVKKYQFGTINVVK